MLVVLSNQMNRLDRHYKIIILWETVCMTISLRSGVLSEKTPGICSFLRWKGSVYLVLYIVRQNLRTDNKWSVIVETRFSISSDKKCVAACITLHRLSLRTVLGAVYLHDFNLSWQLQLLIWKVDVVGVINVGAISMKEKAITPTSSQLNRYPEFLS